MCNETAATSQLDKIICKQELWSKVSLLSDVSTVILQEADQRRGKWFYSITNSEFGFKLLLSLVWGCIRHGSLDSQK